MKKREYWGLLLLLGLAFGVRVVSLDAQGLWRDEVDALNFATAPWAEMVARFTQPGWNGPLYFLLLRGWIALTGRTAFAMRYLSLLWGVLGVALSYPLGKRLVGRRAACWATLLASYSPYLVWYAQEIKMYTWVPALVLLALYALERACERPRWGWWLLVLITTSCAFYSHILAALLIPIEVLWFLLRPRRHRRAWRGGLLTLGLLTAPYLPLLRWQLPLIFQTRQTGYPAHSLSEMAAALASGWSAGIAAQGQPLLAWIYSGLALLGLGWLLLSRREQRRQWRYGLLLTGWLTLPLLVIWDISLRAPLFTDRYLIWTAPAYYFLIGAGLTFLSQRKVQVAILLALTLVSAASVNLYHQAYDPIKPQFREAAAYLHQKRGPEELLLFQIPYNQITLAYYLPAPMSPWTEAPYTNWRTPEGEYQITPEVAGERTFAALDGHKQVWLVYSESSLWDERELVKAWLDAHAHLLTVQEFHGVNLYRYQLD
ncbi:MAG TPA: glycosyltransferase family 39 protein [Thermoflexia bacterium]|nr:glycosyltransferase family 39 protein [Thermoflexia bacterium]